MLIQSLTNTGMIFQNFCRGDYGLLLVKGGILVFEQIIYFPDFLVWFCSLTY